MVRALIRLNAAHGRAACSDIWKIETETVRIELYGRGAGV
jgi:hypothetical protein